MNSSFIKLTLKIALAFCVATSATAQTLTFLGDNNVDHPSVSNAGDFTKVGNHVYFWAQGVYGQELYRADSTGAINLVKETGPGSLAADIGRFIEAGGKLYFLTDAHNYQSQFSNLWQSDGTAEGTNPVNLRINNVAYRFQQEFPLVALGDKVFFTADGRLFKTDGTDAGTTTVAGLRVPDFPMYYNVINAYCVYNGNLYIGAKTSLSSPIRLYRTDGTATGTHAIKQIPSAIDQFADVDGTLYFREGGRLWKTDGTESGTVAVNGEGANKASLIMRASEGKLYFFASDLTTRMELWVTTPDSTVATLVKNFGSGATFIGNSVGYNDKLLFEVFNYPNHGLWISDGTDTGTTVVRANSEDWGIQTNTLLGSSDDKVFFEAKTSAGVQLWTTDGTYEGTKSYRDFEAVDDWGREFVGSCVDNDFYACLAAPGDYRRVYKIDLTTSEPTPLHFASGNPAGLQVLRPPIMLNNKAIYTANDVLNGDQLWVTDGTREGTLRLTDFDQTPNTGAFASAKIIGSLGGSTAIFLTFLDGKTQIWKTRGTPGDIELVKDISLSNSRFITLIPGGPVAYLLEYDNLYTGSYHDPVKDIWRTDGTPAGTYPLNISPDLKVRGPRYLNTDSGLYISAETDAHGKELWKIDHFTGTCSLIKDINPGTTGSLVINSSVQIHMYNGEVYFFANDGIHGTELWKTDGTESGTQMVKDIGPETPSYAGNVPSAFTATTDQGEFLYFFHYGFWRTDGTEAGTLRLAENETQQTFHWAQLNGKIYYSGYTADHGTALWVTDGSPAGTHLLKDIHPAAGTSSLHSFAATNNAVFFSADDGQHGVELWMTDGTTEGTRLVQDICPGAISSNPQNTYALGNHVYTTADEYGFASREIWYSSAEMGTAARLADIETGPLGSQPGYFAHLGDAIVFSAFSAESGFDLYSITGTESAAVEDWQLFD